jgi:16S rRNA pseudouridine516 synthase
MMAARGKPVTYLKRLKFGPLELDDRLPKGSWRLLNDGELEALFRHSDETYVKLDKKL